MVESISTNFKTHVVRNFTDYLNVIKLIKNEQDTVWFRGQENASYRLTPSALRESYEINDQFDRVFEPRKLVDYNNKGNTVAYVNVQGMLKEFKEMALEHLEIEPKNELEWYLLAQHYGVPTTLLDWTTDPLVALFFALPQEEVFEEDVSIEDAINDFGSYPYSNKGAAVFVIEPGRLNELQTNYHINGNPINFPLDVNSDFNLLKGYLDRKNSHLSPCCITSNMVDKRICRQSGKFTIHGLLVWPLDHPDVIRREIHKIFIPNQCIKEMREMLNILDVTHESIYGESELDDISKNISEASKQKLRSSISELVKKYEIEIAEA